jgi:putative nucleotidyltransferase-like protein
VSVVIPFVHARPAAEARGMSGKPLWPTPAQELLLRAAVVPGAGALAAWDAWKLDHDLVESELDHGSFRLMALVYRNLLAQGAEEPLMPRLKGIYRYWWCSNQRLFYRAASVIRGLGQAGIPSLVLKGAAVSVAHYQDTGVRPMGDVDLLVPADRAADAVACLELRGWRPARPRVADLIRYQHSVQMVHENGETLDLHWHVLAECVGRNADQGFWRRAVPIRILDAPTLALGPGDALLHAVVHGMRWNAEPTIRWVADAMAILHASGRGIDWDGVVREAVRRRVVLRLRIGLEYLRHRMGAPIPEHALERLRAERPALLERMESRVLALDADDRGGWRPGHALLIAVQYLRFMSDKTLLQTLAETPEYTRYRLRARRRPAPALLRHLKRKVRRLFGRAPRAARRA